MPLSTIWEETRVYICEGNQSVHFVKETRVYILWRKPECTFCTSDIYIVFRNQLALIAWNNDTHTALWHNQMHFWVETNLCRLHCLSVLHWRSIYWKEDPIHWLKNIVLLISSQDVDFHHHHCLYFLFMVYNKRLWVRVLNVTVNNMSVIWGGGGVSLIGWGNQSHGAGSNQFLSVNIGIIRLLSVITTTPFGNYGTFETMFDQKRWVGVVSLIGWGNQSIHRKSLTNFITKCCIEYTSVWAGFELTTLVVKGTDCTNSYKSKCHTITTTAAPECNKSPSLRYKCKI